MPRAFPEPCRRGSFSHMRSLDLRRIASAFFVVAATAASLYAQSANTGTLIGTATDPSGAVVPGARVELKDLSTNVMRTALTNGAGQYSFPGVPPGTYSVRASATGFQEFTVPRVAIEIGQSYTVNLQLEVG